MHLYLMRHGQALPAAHDDFRELSPHGTEQVREIAARLADLPDGVTSIRHSPLVRAQQTAQLVCEALPQAPPCVRQADLLPESDPETILPELLHWQENLLIVTHMPFVSRLLYQLTCGEVMHSFSTASVAHLCQNHNGFDLIEILEP